MSSRIGLFTHAKKVKKDSKTSSAVYVDADSLASITNKLKELGAKEVGLMVRDRTGTTRLEGKMFPAADLKDNHFTWLTEKGKEFETRALFYD